MSTPKTCKKCGQTKPGTSEYFYRHRNARDGLMGHCKVCHNAQERGKQNYDLAKKQANRRAYRAANRDKIRARMREYMRAYMPEYKRRKRNERMLARVAAVMKPVSTTEDITP